jgi:hypothetical protein
MTTTESLPYEFLVRWKDGKLSGSHIQFVERTLADGVLVAEKIGNPLPVGAKAFPLQDILDKVSADAVLALADATAAHTETKAELDTLQEKHDEVIAAAVSGDAAALAAKIAEVKMTEKEAQAAELQKQIADLQVQLSKIA